MWLMPHPPYSPDLAPCDLFIFMKFKMVLKRQHLGDLEEIKSKMAAYLRSIPKSDFKRCYYQGRIGPVEFWEFPGMPSIQTSLRQWGPMPKKNNSHFIALYQN